MSYSTLELRVAHCTKISAREVITAIKEKQETEILDIKVKQLQLMLNVVENPKFDPLMKICFDLVSGNEFIEDLEVDLIKELVRLCETI
jgi:hypothetical protein